MQDHAFQLFPDGSDDPVISRLLEERRERIHGLGCRRGRWDELSQFR